MRKIFKVSFFLLSLLSCHAQSASLGTYRIYLDEDNNPVKFNIKSNSLFPEQCELSFTYRGYNRDATVKSYSEEEVEEIIQPVLSRLRYSPKKFTIQPGSFQFVAFSYRRQINEKAKEQRIYLNVFCNEIRELEGKGNVNLKPVIMHTVPLVLRQGKVSELDAELEFTDVKITPASVAVTIKHTGNRSVFGDIVLTKGDGKVVEMLQRNAVLYPEMDYKNFAFKTAGIDLKGMWIEFQETSRFDGAKTFKLKL